MQCLEGMWSSMEAGIGCRRPELCLSGRAERSVADTTRSSVSAMQSGQRQRMTWSSSCTLSMGASGPSSPGSWKTEPMRWSRLATTSSSTNSTTHRLRKPKKTIQQIRAPHGEKKVASLPILIPRTNNQQRLNQVPLFKPDPQWCYQLPRCSIKGQHTKNTFWSATMSSRGSAQSQHYPHNKSTHNKIKISQLANMRCKRFWIGLSQLGARIDACASWPIWIQLTRIRKAASKAIEEIWPFIELSYWCIKSIKTVHLA